MNGTIGNKKKNTILLLLVVSVVCMMSMNAFAATYAAKIGTKKYKTLQSAVNAAKNGQTVKMLKAVNASKTVTVSGKKITIDFAKKKYNYKPKAGYAFQLKSGELTLSNINLTGRSGAVNVSPGAILTINSGSAVGCISNSGTMIVKNGKFQGAGSEEDDEGGLLNLPAIRNYGSLTIKKAAITAKNRPAITNYGKALIKSGSFKSTTIYYNLINNEGAKGCTLTIEGGKYTGTVSNECRGGGQLLIHGGTFTPVKNQTTVRNANGRVVISGGSFTGTNNHVVINNFDDELDIGGTLIITGGTFKSGGSYGTVVNESEMIITGGTILLNGAKKGAVRFISLGSKSAMYISSYLGLTAVEE